MTSPTQRSLAHLRSQGYLVELTERWNPYARIRQDLFGFVDILALKDGQTVAVQTTSSGNVSARRKKILQHENLCWLQMAGWKILIHGWRKNSKGQWVLKEESL